MTRGRIGAGRVGSSRWGKGRIVMMGAPGAAASIATTTRGGKGNRSVIGICIGDVVWGDWY